MKNVPLTTLTGPLVIVPSGGGNPSTLGNYPRSVLEVNSSAIIKGDKRNPNPWSYRIISQRPFTGTAIDRSGSYGGGCGPLRWNYSGPMGPIETSSGLVPTLTDATSVQKVNAYNKALDDLNDKVRGGLDLSIAMAEASATFRMVRALSRTRRYFSGIGSKRWANEWLELQYGWKPLLSDIYNAAEEIIRVNDSLMWFKGRGSDAKDTSETRTTASDFDISGVSGYTYGPLKASTKLKLYSACELKILLKAPTSLNQVARWTSLNPLSIAWELTPYSFVFDWFFDVGSYLRNVETAVLYNSAFSAGYRSELSVAEQNTTINWSNWTTCPYFTRVVYVNGKSSGTRKDFSRVLLGSYPLPRVPQIKTDLSSSRLLSAASLLRQFLR